MDESIKKTGRVASAIRRDPVLYISMLAAAVSMMFVPPSEAYLKYVDLRILCLLLSLMLAVAGLRKAGVFDAIVSGMLRRVSSTRTLVLVMVGLCFFSSMLITNDVSLITFVPLAILTLTEADKNRLIIPVIVLQTIAANLGSMLTPLGNPQNLYLYALSGMSTAQFIGVMALPTALSFLLLVVCVLFFRREPVAPRNEDRQPVRKPLAVLWLLLFIVCVLAVMRVLPYYVALGIIVAAALVTDIRLLLRADYGLLLTFVFFFILIGNIKSIPAVSQALSGLIGGRELAAGILLSQIISNVPAAMLLSGFTSDYRSLLVGVNLGGLGTLIASMASLISYKAYAATPGARIGRYLLIFSLLNLAFLALLWLAVLI